MESLSVLQVLKLIKECFQHANESVNRQRLMNPFARTIAEVRRGMIHSVQNPLGRQKAFHSNGSSGVDSCRRDTNLGPQSEPESVGKPAARIMENARTIHMVLEITCSRI